MNRQDPSFLRFADVEIDVRDGRVVRGGNEEHLRQKVFQVLLYLIEHRDRAVSKDELVASVWEGTAVTDDAVVQCIVDLRRALGDDARNPVFIRTIAKRGYRFVAPMAATIEVEATESIELEVVDDPVVPRRRLESLVVPAVALVLAVLTGAVWISARGAQGARERTPLPSDRPSGSEEALTLYDQGMRMVEAWNPAAAIQAFENALKVDPQFVMARARIGYVHGILGYDAAQARPHIEQALKMSGRATEHERQQIQAWLDVVDGRYQPAIDRYRLILERWPTDIESHRNLARLLAGEEQLEQSLEVLEHARTIEPRSTQILNSLGAYSLIGKHEEAISALRKHVELAPNEANAWDSLGLSLQWAGRYEESLDSYARALELRPDFSIVRYHRAGVYVQLGRFRDALADLQVCLNAARGVSEQGRAYGTIAEVHRIRGDLQSMLSAESQIPAGSGWKAVRSSIDADAAAWKEDEWKRREGYAGRGSRSDLRPVLFHSGYAALRQGRTEEGLDLYRQALRFRPLIWYVDPLETILGDALFDLGRYEEAAKEYRRVLAINPNYARARFGLARALDASGRRNEARVEYERFVQLWRDADADARDLIAARAGGALASSPAGPPASRRPDSP